MGGEEGGGERQGCVGGTHKKFGWMCDGPLGVLAKPSLKSGRVDAVPGLHLVRRYPGGKRELGSLEAARSHWGNKEKHRVWLRFRKSEMDSTEGSSCGPALKTSPHGARTWLLERFPEAYWEGGGCAGQRLCCEAAKAGLCQLWAQAAGLRNGIHSRCFAPSSST